LAIEGRWPSLSEPIAERLGTVEQELEWLSPIPGDDFAEYRDQAFLDRIGAGLTDRPLSSFWPSNGPQWDGLARSKSGDIVLVEAKAYIAEMASPPSQASAASLAKIRAALQETQAYLEISGDRDWAGAFYQYANRLAHLYLLRTLNRLPAWLVFVHFIGDSEMKGPNSRDEWETAIDGMHEALGIGATHKLKPHVIDVFLDVRVTQGSGGC
jgi:hypothetical protein